MITLWRRLARDGALETDSSNDHAPLEIQRLDDAESFSKELGVFVPQLNGDGDAVVRFREAFRNDEPHAVLAYQLLRENSPKEFDHWRMKDWLSNITK